MVSKFAVRRVLLGIAMAVAAFGGASAETWYVVSVDRSGATLVDADSRQMGPAVTINTRLVHPGIQEYRKIPIVASQFTLEFDCKAGRMRTIGFSLVDLDGRIPGGLSTNKVRDWDTVETKGNSAVFKAFACDGKALPKAVGPYKRFTDMVSRYLMWLGDPGAGDFAEWAKH